MLPPAQNVGVHRQTHGTAGLTPVHAGLDEDLVETFLLCLHLDQMGTGHHVNLLDAIRHLAALGDGRRGAQILNPRIGTGADKDLVNLDIGHRDTTCQPHIVQGALVALLAGGVGLILRLRHNPADGYHHIRRGTPADMGLDISGIELHHRIKMGIIVRLQCLPVGNGLVPGLAGGREAGALDIGDGFLVDTDQPHPGTPFNGHVADGHAALDGQGADGAAAKLDGVACATRGADLADNGQDHILGGHSGAELSVHLDQHIFHLAGDQALGSQHMLHLGGADTVGQAAESAMGGGVGITTHHGGTGQGYPQLWANHVDDALTDVVDLELGDAKFVAVIVEGLHLNAGDFVDDGADAAAALLPVGGHVVVRRRHIAVGAPRLAAGHAQAVEGLGRRHFVDDVAVDVEQRSAIRARFHQVGVPKLVVEGFTGHV